MTVLKKPPKPRKRRASSGPEASVCRSRPDAKVVIERVVELRLAFMVHDTWASQLKGCGVTGRLWVTDTTQDSGRIYAGNVSVIRQSH